jgi:hypothetical protein
MGRTRSIALYDLCPKTLFVICFWVLLDLGHLALGHLQGCNSATVPAFITADRHAWQDAFLAGRKVWCTKSLVLGSSGPVAHRHSALE